MRKASLGRPCPTIAFLLFVVASPLPSQAELLWLQCTTPLGQAVCELPKGVGQRLLHDLFSSGLSSQHPLILFLLVTGEERGLGCSYLEMQYPSKLHVTYVKTLLTVHHTTIPSSLFPNLHAHTHKHTHIHTAI